MTAAVAASLVGVSALAGCAAGTDAMTNAARTTTNSVSGAVGTISLRNVYVVGPAEKGGRTPVVAAVFNAGTEEDTLIEVSSPAAGAGEPPEPAVIRPDGANIYFADSSAPTLTDLTRDLPVGSAVSVTFTFAKAGSVTLDVPVEEPAPGAVGETEVSEDAEGEETVEETTEPTTEPTREPTREPTTASATPSATSTTATFTPDSDAEPTPRPTATATTG